MKFSEYYKRLYEGFGSFRKDRKFTKEIRKLIGSSYKHIHKIIFGDKSRIYIPFKEKDNDNIKNLPSYIKLNNYLNKFGYEIDDYSSGIAISKKQNNYMFGKNVVREITIGKLLERKITKMKKEIDLLEEEIKKLSKEKNTDKIEIKKEEIKNLSESLELAKELLKNFVKDPARSLARKSSEDFLVAISKHPIDVGSMSVNKGWTSCMAGSLAIQEAVSGTIIAYLIKKEDKQISNPICRVLIKPFFKYKEEEKQPYFITSDVVYGANVPGFVETVKKFFNEINDKISKEMTGLYGRNPQSHNLESSIQYGDFIKLKKGNIVGYNIYKNNIIDSDIIKKDFVNKMKEYPLFIKVQEEEHNKSFINKTWKKLEEQVLKDKDPILAAQYAAFVLEERWPEAEDIILTDPLASCLYLIKVLGHRDKEFEKSVFKDIHATFAYLVVANFIKKVRVPEAEDILKQNEKYWKHYCLDRGIDPKLN